MLKTPRPKILGDVRLKGVSPWRDGFSVLPNRLNLSFRPPRRFNLVFWSKYAVGAAAVVFLLTGFVSAPTLKVKASSPTSTTDVERQALEAQLSDLENQIDQYENQIIGFQKQGKSLKNEISTLNGKVAKLNLQIQAINLTLSDLNRKIGDTQSQIAATKSDIADRRASLAQILMRLYIRDNTSLAEIFLTSPHLSDFFSDLNNLTLLQNNLRVNVEQIIDLHNQLEDKQDQFLLAKSDAQSVQNYQNAQKEEVANIKAEKNKLLDVTKGQESKYQALLNQTKETAAQIRSRIFQLLGGGELTFEEAYQYAKLASGATGVKPSLILAVLDRESALGQNVGKCSYKTAMSSQNQTLFLAITEELNLNPDIMTVSCPNKDGVYGGAMGPAQFVPSTWNLYKDNVAKITGHNPPSPWNSADAFVATALYLEGAAQSCNAIYSSAVSRDRCAAAKYYAGSRWRSYLWTYGEAVVSRAQGFEEDISMITTG